MKKYAVSFGIVFFSMFFVSASVFAQGSDPYQSSLGSFDSVYQQDNQYDATQNGIQSQDINQFKNGTVYQNTNVFTQKGGLTQLGNGAKNPNPQVSANQTLSASCVTAIATVADIAKFVVCLVNNYLIPLVVTFSFVLVIWRGVQFVMESGNEEERKKLGTNLIWAIIILFVIVSIWGLVRFGLDFLGLNAGIVIPQLK